MRRLAQISSRKFLSGLNTRFGAMSKAKPPARPLPEKEVTPGSIETRWLIRHHRFVLNPALLPDIFQFVHGL